MKKTLAFIMFLLLLVPLIGQAEVIPAHGQGQIGYEAVVLCQSLTVRESWSTSSKGVKTLKAGDVFSTQSYSDGFIDCFPSENGGRAGWVKEDYVIVNPAWYKIDASTPVYAWNSENAYQVALLDRGDRYPILKTEGEWIVIGLRGASGWIHDPAGAAAASHAAFYPAELQYVVYAEVTTPDGQSHALADPAALTQLGDLMAHCHVRFASECPFEGKLTLTLASGRAVSLDVATDGCDIFRTESGDYYQYGDNIPHEKDSSSDAGRLFWSLFSLDSADFYPAE